MDDRNAVKPASSRRAQQGANPSAPERRQQANAEKNTVPTAATATAHVPAATPIRQEPAKKGMPKGVKALLAVVLAVIAIIAIVFAAGAVTNAIKGASNGGNGAYTDYPTESVATQYDDGGITMDSVSSFAPSSASSSSDTSSAYSDPDSRSGDYGYDSGLGGSSGTKGDPFSGDQLMTYSSDIVLETVDYDADSDKLASTLDESGAVVVYSDEIGGTYRREYITVRVPADRYDALMSALEGVATMVRCSESSDNITSDYDDVAARIETLEAQKRKLDELVAKAENVDDLLSIEDRIQSVEYDLARAYSNKASMDADIAYSVVDITLEDVSGEGREPGAEEDFATRISRAFGDAMDDFVATMQDGAVAMVLVWPWLAALAVVIVIVALCGRAASRSKRFKELERMAAAQAQQAQATPQTQPQNAGNAIADGFEARIADGAGNVAGHDS